MISMQTTCIGYFGDKSFLDQLLWGGHVTTSLNYACLAATSTVSLLVVPIWLSSQIRRVWMIIRMRWTWPAISV